MEIFGISVAHIVFTIVSFFLVAFIAVQLALNKFKKERLWEHKFEIYRKITEIIYIFKGSFHVKSTRYIDPRDDDVFYSHMSEFIKFKDTASLIVSKEIISFLKEYEKKINNLNEESKIDGVLNEKLLYEKAKNLSTEYLEKFIEIARHDLNGNCFKKLLDKLPSCCSCKN